MKLFVQFVSFKEILPTTVLQNIYFLIKTSFIKVVTSCFLKA